MFIMKRRALKMGMPSTN